MKIGKFEFITLMALLMSVLSLSIDTILPGLSIIGADLGVQNANDTQMIISVLFIGMSLGLMVFGVLSDFIGRKNAIYLGMLMLIIGNTVSMLSDGLGMMLVGRVLQGFGAASCRVVTIAMVRDLYEGKEMGQIMSLIMMVFIMVPTVAPTLGQAILFMASWKTIFGFTSVMGALGLVWLATRQQETLPAEKRLAFSPSTIAAGIKETILHPVSFFYTLAAGLIFGAFLGYLNSAQQILQIQYDLGTTFSIYFGGLALVIGASSFANSRLVMKFQMQTLCRVSLLIVFGVSLLFALYILNVNSNPSLFIFMSYLTVAFFCVGTLFGNLATLALKPMGHIAGVANSVISAKQMFMSALIGGYIGHLYNGTVLPMVLGFVICSILAFGVILVPPSVEDE